MALPCRRTGYPNALGSQLAEGALLTIHVRTMRCVEVNGLTVQIPHFALGAFDWLWVLESERKPPEYAYLSLSLCVHLANQDFMDFMFLIFPKATLKIFVLSAVPIRRGFEMDTESLSKTSVICTAR